MLNNKSQDIKALVTYVEKTLGFKVATRNWEDEGKLPLLLREQYSFYIIRFSNFDSLVFSENSDNSNTPSIISKHCKILTQYWPRGIIYSKETISSTNRARLIQAKVPFIIPGKQLYLPFIGIDFKEIFPPEKKATQKLSPSAQLLILGKLYKKDWIKDSPTKISKKTGISNMSIGRAFNELVLHNIAFVRTSGKEKILKFNLLGQELWENTLYLLRSPVTSSKTVPYRNYNNLVISGLSALSRYSMLSESNLTTFAVFNRVRNLIVMTDPLENNFNKDMIIQKWSYNPLILSREKIADPLSVYLELKDSDDERIEEALEDLMKDIKW